MKRTWIATIMVTAMFVGMAHSANVSKSLNEEEQLLILQKRVEAQKIANSPIPPKQIAAYSAEFAEACKSFLTTFDKGSEITIERLNQFMGTSAGKFTIAMVGWKVLGKDAIEIVTGIGQTLLGFILLIPYMLFLIMIYRFFVMGRRVVVSQDGKKKTYAWKEPVANSLSGESYAWWCAFTAVAAIIFTIVICVLIF